MNEDTRRRINDAINQGSLLTLSLADLESYISDAPLAEEEIERLDSPCRIHIHSHRKREVDADGVSAKAAIDGAVHAGILYDDSPKYVKEVSYSQEKDKEEITYMRIYI